LWAFNFPYLTVETGPVISRSDDPSIFLLVVGHAAGEQVAE